MIQMIKYLNKNFQTLEKNKIIKKFKRSSKLKVELLQMKIRANEIKGAADTLNSRIDIVEERTKLLQNES